MMAAARLIARLIDLLTMLVLARLLSPADFGLVAIAMTLISILEAALELPLSQALVRLPEIKPAYYDTAFTLGALRGVILAVLVCASAVPFSDFYHQHGLAPLICALSIAPAARGLVNPRLAQYAKDLNFKWEFLFELSGKAVAFGVAILVAVTTHSYWSIAACTIAAPVIFAGLSYSLLPFKPKLTLAEWRVFGDFLGWMSLSQVIMAINWQSEQLLLGKLMRPTQLGLFSTANNLSSVPTATLFGPILRPLLSAFAALKDNQLRLANSYRNAASAIVAIGLPLLVGEAILAGPEVRLLLGPKWLGAIPMLRWLALSLIPGLFAVPFTPLGMALNQTKELTWRNLVQLAVKLPLVVLGAIFYGFAGVIAARVISECFTSIYCMVVAGKLLGISVIGQITDNWRSCAAAFVMFETINDLLPPFAVGNGAATLAASIVLVIAIGAISYAGSLIILWWASGRPSGIEATANHMIAALWQRLRTSQQPRDAV
jgi:PST family polysaccharide transporter